MPSWWTGHVPAEEGHGVVPLLVEGHREVVVLRHQRRPQDPVDGLDPVAALELRVRGELVGAVRRVHDEPEPLLPEAGPEARHYQVPGAGVTQEYFPLQPTIYNPFKLSPASCTQTKPTLA